MKSIKWMILWIAFLMTTGVYSNSLDQCQATLRNDTLMLSNNRISRTFLWNHGHLTTLQIYDKQKGQIWQMAGDSQDLSFPNIHDIHSMGKFEVERIEQSPTHSNHLKINVIASLGNLKIKRCFRLYPDCPAIACDIYLKGCAGHNWQHIDSKKRVETAVMERLTPEGNHWQVEAISFQDETDDHNTLVHSHKFPVYRRQSRVQGNLLFVTSKFNDSGFFILKESPGAGSQIHYPGCDFLTIQKETDHLDLSVVGFGISSQEIQKNEWTRCYGFVTGVSDKNEYSMLTSLRLYQNKVCPFNPEVDDMIMMNTWGDRGQDARISESFILKELDLAHKLGITHLQIDDGWQIGRSRNSAFKGGSLNEIWRSGSYWKIDPEKFPDGFRPVLEKAKSLDIEIALWFNPSTDSSYVHWRDDAQVLIDLYKAYGICIFKIDGVSIPDKLAETNFRSILDLVLKATDHQVYFNLDVTGIDKRPGYHYFSEYGNIFLENRYTDWGNYYPYWTLRNLWMLSKYIPAQKLQIEFLNKWRNPSQYPENDVLAPGKIPFEYIFATTMMAQPLAWFEASNLPDEAFEIAPLIQKYREHMSAIHSGQIFPIGDEPSGRGWTGFQSMHGNQGYLLIFREYSDLSQKEMDTWLPEKRKIRFEHILGQGQSFQAKTGKSGKIRFKLTDQWNFALYHYFVQ